MALIWDYDVDELKKTPFGRLKILERLINYGPTEPGEKIDLAEVKKNWDKLDIHSAHRRRLMEFLIWEN